MPIKYTGTDPLDLAGYGRVEAGDVVRAGADRERVLLSAYPDRFEAVKPKRRRARRAAESKPTADRSMRSPSGEG